MNKKHTTQSAFFNLRILITLLLCAVATCSLISGPLLAFFRPEASTNGSQRALTFAERVTYQRAIEEVYWRHRIWPKENLNPKPSFDAVMSQTQLEKKVEDYLRKSQALEDYWQHPITAEQLQAEMNRMANHTKQPDVLRELFESLGNDPFIIAECLARPAVAERVLTNRYAYHQRIHGELKEPLESWLAKAESQIRTAIAAPMASYRLPTIGAGGCIDDTWTATGTANDPDARNSHTAVWTGNEMIVWGGVSSLGALDSGGRYNPSTDSWTATSAANVPDARYYHTAIWTGSEMIIWGGQDTNGVPFNSGGKYNPNTDSWTATSTVAAPEVRRLHSAIWTGSEMIVWGGFTDTADTNTGGRYSPTTDSWISTSITGAPDARDSHTAVWTGSGMIVWGGLYFDGVFFHYFDTGGRYNLDTNSWTATSTNNAPDRRSNHTAIWTGSEMIVWGGENSPTHSFNTGGGYDPGTDGWAATSTANVPDARYSHTAVWTGNEMIVWGGVGLGALNSGGRYNPDTDGWAATNTTNAPSGRRLHTAVWTGSEMIVWGGFDGNANLNTGGRYCAQSGAPTPTPTPTAMATATATATPTTTPSATPTATPTATSTATATPTPTPTPTPCTGRCSPTPRPRLIPRLRPTPPPHLTPVPPPPSPRPTPVPRPTPPPHLTPVPSPTSPRPTPAPRP